MWKELYLSTCLCHIKQDDYRNILFSKLQFLLIYHFHLATSQKGVERTLSFHLFMSYKRVWKELYLSTCLCHIKQDDYRNILFSKLQFLFIYHFHLAIPQKGVERTLSFHLFMSYKARRLQKHPVYQTAIPINLPFPFSYFTKGCGKNFIFPLVYVI